MVLNQIMDSGGHCLRLLPRCGPCHNLRLFWFPLILSRAEPVEMVLNKGNGRTEHKSSLSFPGQVHNHILFSWHILPLGQLDQMAHHVLTHMKQILDSGLPVGILPRIHGDRDNHFPGMDHEKFQKPVLHRRKSCVAVHGYDAVLNQPGVGKHPAQHV